MGLQPFQGVFDGERCLIVDYIRESDRMLVYTAKGEIICPLRETVTVDWHYDDEASAWMINPQSDLNSVLRSLDVAVRGLSAIAEYTHVDTCPSKDDFDVWDCNCNKLKPNLMAQLTLEEMEDDGADDEEVPVSDVPDEDPV